jgi:branched-chain amino acid aminotransferase
LPQAVDANAGQAPAPPGAARSTGGLAFVEGSVVAIEDARIPITDTGFLRSDATYDVVAVWGGSFFRLDDHLDRFLRGCEQLRLDPGLSRERIEGILVDLVRRSGLRDSYVEMICTRGVASAGVRDPRRFTNRFYAYAVPYVWLLPWERRDDGMHAAIARTVRRISPAAVDPTVKNFHWGDLTRALYEAYDRGAEFPILLGDDGCVTEGAGYNVFVVAGGRLLTPDRGALEGITRRTVLELAAADGIAVEARAVTEELLTEGSELFATSTAGGVMPITALDGEPVADGRPGPVTRRLRDLYWAAHEDPRHLTPVDYGNGERGDAA